MHAVTRISTPGGDGGHKVIAKKGGSRNRESRNREAALYCTNFAQCLPNHGEMF